MVVVLLLVPLLVLLFSSGILAASSPPTDLANDPFYQPPKGFESTAPGTVLRSRDTPRPVIALNVGSAHQLLYRTTNSFGEPIATVSTILIPPNADNTKLLSYQLSQDAATAICAPSFSLQMKIPNEDPLGLLLPQLELLFIGLALSKGWMVNVPDHLGPNSAFLANHMSGQAVLDGLRATLASSHLTNMSSDPTIALWGFSGGSLSTGFAAELQPSYAPEVELHGVILGSPVPNILPVMKSSNKGMFAGMIPAVIQGLSNEYPEIAQLVEDNLKPEKKASFAKSKDLCLTGNILEYARQDVFSYTKDPGVFTGPVVSKFINHNALGHRTPKVPMLIYKSIGDEISPVGDTDDLVAKYCEAGANINYKRDVFSEHVSMTIVALPEVMLWLNDRMNRVPVDPGCTNSTKFMSLIDPISQGLLGASTVQSLLKMLPAPLGLIL